MNLIANDWASSDPTQNITLGEADQFKNQMAAALTIQFAETFVKTASGEIVNETALRHSPLPAAPVNLWATLSGTGATPVNVAQMRAAIRSAARSGNPTGELQTILHHALPKSDVSILMLRFPAVEAAITAAISKIG